MVNFDRGVTKQEAISSLRSVISLTVFSRKWGGSITSESKNSNIGQRDFFAPLFRAIAGRPPLTTLQPNSLAIARVLSMENASATIISSGATDCRLMEDNNVGRKRSSLNVGIIMLIGSFIYQTKYIPIALENAKNDVRNVKKVYIYDMAVFTKIGALIIAVLVIALVANTILERIYPASSPRFGVTFSPRYARYLKLDWQKTYIEILDDLKVRDLRISSYWDTLEPQPGQFDFTETDFMLNEAGKRGAKVIMVLGAKQPRWPECHNPAWAVKLTVLDRQEKMLQLINKVVKRYNDDRQIWAWQVENEPLLDFGEGCDEPDINFLKKEISLVKSLSNKTIILTDSGELGFWNTSMSLSDVFGTTLYRQVYDKILGTVTYPLPPYFYNIKSSLIRSIFAPKNKKTIIVELQAEPWFSNGYMPPNLAEQAKAFPVKKIESYADYARKTGFDQAYLWGVEWWYLMAKNGYPQYLNYAETLFK